MTITEGKKGTVVGEAPNNDGKFVVDLDRPYIVEIELEGTSAILFHRWSNESVEAKANAAKGSKAKKTDDVDSYVYRCEDGTIGIPGEYLRGAIVEAGRYKQDPRSPRKSARDLLKAAVVPLTEVASLGKADWDYLDQRRVVVQRNAITRSRPAFLAGWRATFQMMCNLPQYVPPTMLCDVVAEAGRIVGLADFRPTYGRFHVVRYEVTDY